MRTPSSWGVVTGKQLSKTNFIQKNRKKLDVQSTGRGGLRGVPEGGGGTPARV